MPIPASVILYVNWGNGTFSSPTYTADTPDVPDAHTWGFANSGTVQVEAGSPWNGQSVAYLPNYNSNVSSTLTSATMQATSGRVLIEVNTADVTFYKFARFSATNAANGVIWFVKSGGNLLVRAEWNGSGSTAEVSLGTYPTAEYIVEYIYDFNNGTANQRLRARTWSIGGSAGSMNNATSTAGSAATSDQFTSFNAMPDGEIPGLKFGRIMVSDDTAEDLSAVSEGGGAAVGLMGGMSL